MKDAMKHLATLGVDSFRRARNLVDLQGDVSERLRGTVRLYVSLDTLVFI
jgi:hypothetical protein